MRLATAQPGGIRSDGSDDLHLPRPGRREPDGPRMADLRRPRGKGASWRYPTPLSRSLSSLPMAAAMKSGRLAAARPYVARRSP